MYDPLYHSEPAHSGSGYLSEPLQPNPNYKPPKPAANKLRKKRRSSASKRRPPPTSLSRKAKEQPRDWHGRFTSIGRSLKKIGRSIKKGRKTVRKIRRSFSPKYHLRRIQRIRRTNEREELTRQGFTLPKRQHKRSTKRTPGNRARR